MPKRPIPFSRNSSHFVHMANCLTMALNEVKGVLNQGTKALWASCRLNKTGEQNSPVFAGWVEDSEASVTRIQRNNPYPPAEMRFGDTHPSLLFSECLRQPLGQVVTRQWGPQQPDLTSQRLGEKFYGETHRRSIPIMVDQFYVGTLNVGFLGNPNAVDHQIRGKLATWAQAPNSPLVSYIKDHLECSGPAHP